MAMRSEIYGYQNKICKLTSTVYMKMHIEKSTWAPLLDEEEQAFNG